ncbi:AraC family transcriptional regulator [Spongiibacter taiwanensis]|uniref:helix-turn-helix transcriptional regulator n=1 Tax=Spongiibacter taiwanensis TaxID=1748242 RepID=UPI0020353D5B|nr:AraC family transcriptional regulator [Spongiibacter taiwanensis]USA44497.1 AraC family transcriptional regulator [Spongiibacter taiwanensis]
MHLIRIGAFSGFERLTRSLGQNPVTLIRQAGLSAAVFRDPNSYVAYAKMAELLELAARACAEPFFGFRLALGHGIGVFDEIVVRMCQEPSVSDAIAMMNRHLYLHASGIQLKQHRKGKEVLIEISLDVESPLGINQLVQFSVGRLFSLMETLTNSDPYVFPINLRQAAPDADVFPPHLNKVAFASSFDGMRVPLQDMERKPTPDQRLLQRQFSVQLQHLEEQYPESFEAQVRAAISKLLPSGDCNLNQVAANLGLHPRRLQRMLKKQDASYGELVREVRQTIAERHLRTGVVPITELALSLGYAELAVFSREFKSWTGMSPSAWREQSTLKKNSGSPR